MVPEEVRRLFQVLTGEDMTDADEDALFAVAGRLESGAVAVEVLGPVVGEVVGRVRGGFSGKAADRFAERLAGFGPVLESGGVGLRELAGFVRNLALQVQYLKFVTVGGLLLLLAEVVWAVSMAGVTGGASMAWLAARFVVMRFLLSRWWGQLFVRLAVAQVVGVGLQLVVEVGAQGAQFALGTRKKWDGQLTGMAVGVGSFSALLAVPLSALGNVVANAITKVLVRGLGDEIDAEVLAAAAKHAVGEHADQYPLSSMARFADVVSKSLDDFTGMSVRAMWAARFGHGLGESVEEGLTEMFGEAGYGALSGQGAQWNPFSFTAGLSEAVVSGVGNLMGLALRGQLIPAGRARDAANETETSDSHDAGTDTSEESKADFGSQPSERPTFVATFSEKPGSLTEMSKAHSWVPLPGSEKADADSALAPGGPLAPILLPAGPVTENAPPGGVTAPGALRRQDRPGTPPPLYSPHPGDGLFRNDATGSEDPTGRHGTRADSPPSAYGQTAGVDQADANSSGVDSTSAAVVGVRAVEPVAGEPSASVSLSVQGARERAEYAGWTRSPDHAAAAPQGARPLLVLGHNEMVVSGDALAEVQGVGADVLARVDPGRGPAWMLYGADGSRPRLVDPPAELAGRPRPEPLLFAGPGDSGGLMDRAARLAPVLPDIQVVGVHVTARGSAVLADGRRVGPEDFVAEVRRDRRFVPGLKVALLGCGAYRRPGPGVLSFAERFARALRGSAWVADTDVVQTVDGGVHATEVSVASDGRLLPRFVDGVGTGRWSLLGSEGELLGSSGPELRAAVSYVVPSRYPDGARIEAVVRWPGQGERESVDELVPAQRSAPGTFVSRRLLFATASAALVLFSLTRGQSALSQPARLAWEPCGDGQGEFGTVEVPIDWDDPDGAKTQIAIGRLRATEPQNRIGVLFVAPGGPGGSGIDSYILGAGPLQGGELRKRFDIVSWDQRGVKRSNEVQCSGDLLAQAPREFPSNEREYRDLLAYNAKLGEDCRNITGPVFDFVDTTSAVRDLDAIRAALGEERLSFYGASYGTQVGQQYAELFPDRIRAMTIDSNMDHSMRSGGRYIETASEDLEGSFNTFADWCERTVACSLYGEDVRAVWDGVYAQAEAGTLRDPATGAALSVGSLLRELMIAMYRPEVVWFGLANRLKALSRGGPAVTAVAAGAEPVQNSYQGIWCDDWSWTVRDFAELRSYRDKAEQVAPHTKLSPFWADVTSCLGWPVEAGNPQHELSIKGAPTILIVKARYDVATPSAWNLAVAGQIDNSVLLYHDGIGHGQYYRSLCVREKVDRYLITLETPDPNTHCEAVYPTQPPPATTAMSTSPPARPALG
ncbi:alpha/beta fold hydrolase [Saccharopolyspora phatthalungensis]|nr:alpha/beta fold hydrolase [Saccharopolyspora phatthalungensis]